MTQFPETKTKPDYEEPNTEPPKREATSPEPGREETSSKPGQEKMNPKPEYETTKPRPDLKTLFTFDGGYCNPPKGYWYAKGTSGNPKGRPPGAKNKPKPLTDKNFNEILRSVYYKNVRSKDGRTISTAQAVTENLADLALAGNMRAIQLLHTSLWSLDAADAAQQEKEYNYAAAYKAHWDHPSRMFGRDRSLTVPHPDDIILDHKNKRVFFTGPRNEEEMLKKLAGEDFREEPGEEGEEDSKNGGIADECPEEMRCQPLPYTRGPGDPPYEGDDERLPRVYRGED